MVIIKSFVVWSFFMLFFITVSACSSSTGSLRYGEANQTDNVHLSSETRFSKENRTSIEDTVIIFDEDIPEYQDPSDLPDDESKIDLTELLKNLEKKKTASDSEGSNATKKDLMLMEIIRYLNTPYKFGGNSLNGIDCSAFTQSVYKNSWLLDINRSAREQFRQGEIINDRSELKFGDLVFFNTRRRVKPGHVGIYIGENLFAHASSKVGVTISSLEHSYYNKRYMGARRIDEE